MMNATLRQVVIIAIVTVVITHRGDRADAGIALTNLIEFGADTSGNFVSEYWVTNSAPAYKLFLIEGGPSGAFLNSGSSVGIDVPLSSGTYTFSIFGDGLDAPPTYPDYGLNLFFNNQTNPSISVFAPVQTNTTAPAFSADGSATTPSLSISPTIAGAGTLDFTAGSTTVSLISYSWATPSLYNLDRVSPMDLGANGYSDWVGQFTLQVSSVPEPSSMTMTFVGMALICSAVGVTKRRAGFLSRSWRKTNKRESHET